MTLYLSKIEFSGEFCIIYLYQMIIITDKIMYEIMFIVFELKWQAKRKSKAVKCHKNKVQAPYFANLFSY